RAQAPRRRCVRALRANLRPVGTHPWRTGQPLWLRAVATAGKRSVHQRVVPERATRTLRVARNRNGGLAHSHRRVAGGCSFRVGAGLVPIVLNQCIGAINHSNWLLSQFLNQRPIGPFSATPVGVWFGRFSTRLIGTYWQSRG